MTSIIDVQRKAQDVIYAAQFNDHSDVGLAMCQQNIAKTFTESLESYAKLEKKEGKRLSDHSSNCAFYQNKNDMNPSSRKILELATLCTSLSVPIHGAALKNEVHRIVY